MANRQIAVLGLNVFGNVLAKKLEEYGVEVLAVDMDPEAVERIAPFVTKAVIANVTKKETLKELKLQDFDTVVVTMSHHFEEAVLCTFLLKELGTKHIIGSARTKRAAIILEKVGADEVIKIEHDVATRVAKRLLQKSVVELVELDDGFAMAEINVQDHWIGHSLSQLNLRNSLRMNIIAVKSQPDYQMNMDFDRTYKVRKNDRFVVITKQDVLDRFDYLSKD